MDGLKDQIATLKGDAEKFPEVQKELDELKAAAEKDGKSSWKVKYDAIKEEFETYKAEQTAKEAAYRALLKQAGVSEKRIDAVLKVTDLDGIELDKDGAVKNADEVTKAIKTEWADFIQTTQTVGANTATPPANNGSVLKTREEIYARDASGRFVMDASQRQEALGKLIAAQQQKG